MKKALGHLEKSDAVLASIITRVGPFRMAYREPKFEALARSIVFQQLSTKAASTIYGRLAEACGGGGNPGAILKPTAAGGGRARLSKQNNGKISAAAGHAVHSKRGFER